MTQNNFLGTIGWIKGNLLTSSDIGEKYDNDTFYPGAPNIPDSAGPVPIALAGSVSSNGKLNDRNILEYGCYKLNKRYGFYGSSGSDIKQWISEAVITFKMEQPTVNGYFFPLMHNFNSSVLELYWDKNNTGKFRVRVSLGDSDIDSEPLVEIGKWYTITLTKISGGLKMDLKQGSNLIVSKNCTTSSGYKFFAFDGLCSYSNTDKKYCTTQINLCGDKTYVK